METLPLILGAGVAILLLNKNKTSSSSSSSPKEATLGKIDLNKPKEASLLELNCLETQFKDKDGNCKFFWIDGQTDDRVKKELDILLLDYKDQSWDKMCADKSIKTGTVEYLPNDNGLKIVKKVITSLWSPVITNKMLPPNAKSPDFIKTIWKRVNSIYFAKVCGIV